MREVAATRAGIISWHASREFNELLLTQPVRRRSLFVALYLALVLPLAVPFWCGSSFLVAGIAISWANDELWPLGVVFFFFSAGGVCNNTLTT